MTGDPPVLEMEGAGLALAAGEIALVLVEDRARMRALTDAACGIAPPEGGGAVRFLGRDWAELRGEEADGLRARIGCALAEGGWPPQLSVADAAVMAAVHHRQLAPDEAVERAADLCRRFGLPGLPLDGPGALDDDALARAALARALLARPDLLVLEQPLREVGEPAPLAPLLDAIAAGRHAATLWMTASLALWGGRAIPATRRYRLLARGGVEEVRGR